MIDEVYNYKQDKKVTPATPLLEHGYKASKNSQVHNACYEQVKSTRTGFIYELKSKFLTHYYITYSFFSIQGLFKFLQTFYPDGLEYSVKVGLQ